MSQVMIVACPHCGGRLTNDGSLSGQVVACALCGGHLHMPALEPPKPARPPVQQQPAPQPPPRKPPQQPPRRQSPPRQQAPSRRNAATSQPAANVAVQPPPQVSTPPATSQPPAQATVPPQTSVAVEEPPSAAERFKARRKKRTLPGNKRVWMAGAAGGLLIVVVGMFFAFSGASNETAPGDGRRLVGQWEIDLDALVSDSGLSGMTRSPARALKTQGNRLQWDFSADGRVTMALQAADRRDRGTGTWRVARREGSLCVVALKWDDAERWEQVTFEFLDEDRMRAPLPRPDSPPLTFRRARPEDINP